MPIKKATKRVASTDSTFKYALRVIETGKFWTGNVRSPNRYARSRYAVASLPRWVPQYQEIPMLWNNIATAKRKWSIHETERQCGIAVPELEIVTFEMKTVETGVQVPDVDPITVRVTRLHRFVGSAVGTAFERLVDSRIDGMEFNYAVKRRGKTKDLIDGRLSDSFSFSTVTFIKTEEDLMHAKLLLGSNFATAYDLNNIKVGDNDGEEE
jgi:hypothetical protein